MGQSDFLTAYPSGHGASGAALGGQLSARRPDRPRQDWWLAREERELRVTFDPALRALWCAFDAQGVPNFNPAFVDEMREFQHGLIAHAGRIECGGEIVQAQLLVVDSLRPGVFSLGGDLALFSQLIAAGDRAALVDYGRACVDVVWNNYVRYGLPLTTASLVRGSAYGGGFEAALSSSLIVAERSAKFAFPEATFGLFPGMGAYHLLADRIGAEAALRMIRDGATWAAEEMKALGVVDILAEDGEGAAALIDYWIARGHRDHADCQPRFERADLEATVEQWAHAALELSATARHRMNRLARAQARAFRTPQPEEIGGRLVRAPQPEEAAHLESTPASREASQTKEPALAPHDFQTVLSPRKLVDEFEFFTKRSTAIGLALAAFDLGLFVSGVLGAILLASPWLKIVAALVAGAAVGSALVLAHDAAHGALVRSARLNRVLARLLFLPSLHNLALWRIEHHRQHHIASNARGLNAWSPLGKAEWDAASPVRKGLERVYRGGLGFGLYYIAERLVPAMLFPRRTIAGGWTRAAWSEFLLVMAWLLLWGAGVSWIAGVVDPASVLAALWWGVVLPFFIGSTLIGWTVYAQHTHPRLPWFMDPQSSEAQPQHLLSVHWRMPGWYRLLSHNVMDHPVHHLLPAVPCYRLPAAQRRLSELSGGRNVVETFSVPGFIDTVRRCKIYDYESHRWLRFDGSVSGAAIVRTPDSGLDRPAVQASP